MSKTEDSDEIIDLEYDYEPYSPADVERKFATLAGTLWSELRERADSLDSERWIAVVLARLHEVIEEFKHRMERVDSMYLARRDQVSGLEKRIRRYQKRYGCIECGEPIGRTCLTDRCGKCSHIKQAAMVIQANIERREKENGQAGVES